jgi:hypothetical protein
MFQPLRSDCGTSSARRFSSEPTSSTDEYHGLTDSSLPWNAAPRYAVMLPQLLDTRLPQPLDHVRRDSSGSLLHGDAVMEIDPMLDDFCLP